MPIHQRGYSAALGTVGAGLGAERSVGERLTQEYSQYLFGAVLDDHRIELLDDAAVNEDRVGDVQRRLILAELNLHRMQRTTWLNLHINAMCRMQVATRQLHGSYTAATRQLQGSYKAATRQLQMMIIITVPALA